ncbi:uncharacterized protein LOC128313380 [Acinonyx jubatus]|uniref:Uncharacterized protein LOC128313380 n=1 Tax=Acinonyx jubatus TaxID=32536 RepID=A0ABM3P7R1_ACIJB|nr:uncharacterized protein LOC128313380 [Acinonyx jubatus]
MKCWASCWAPDNRTFCDTGKVLYLPCPAREPPASCEPLPWGLDLPPPGSAGPAIEASVFRALTCGEVWADEQPPKPRAQPPSPNPRGLHFEQFPQGDPEAVVRGPRSENTALVLPPGSGRAGGDPCLSSSRPRWYRLVDRGPDTRAGRPMAAGHTVQAEVEERAPDSPLHPTARTECRDRRRPRGSRADTPLPLNVQEVTLPGPGDPDRGPEALL